MSPPNSGEEVPPSNIIIQLAEEIMQELKHDSITNKQVKYVKKALKGIIEIAQRHQFITGITGTIDRLESSLSGIAQSQKQQLTNINKRFDKLENTRSWAQVAAKEALPPSLTNSTTPKTSPSLASTAPASPPDTRREDRDLVVNINKDASDQSDKPPPTHTEVREEEKRTLEQLNKALQTSKICVLNDSRVGTVKKLPSGDWRLTMATAREAEVMKRHAQDWMPILGAKASLALPVYGVIIDGIRISSVDLDHPEQTIEELQKQNHRVLPGREIKRLRWLQKPRKGKQYASLVMEFTSPVDANVVINTNELFWQNETRRVRRAIRSATINQCFKCNKYGHRSTQCRNPETCGFCAEQHATAACPSRDDTAKATCANCRKNHPAWSLDCKVREQEKTKVRERITRAEKYWREPATASSVSPGPSSAPTNSSTSTTTKTPRTTTAGQKRPLAERTDNETNSVPKKKNTAVGARTIAEPKPRKPISTPPAEEDENMNMDDDDCSGLSRSSNLSTASQERRNLRPNRTKTQKSREAINIYEEL